MTKPEFIVFDYGNTLLCEPGFSTLRGQEALMEHIISNPKELTASEINRYADRLYASLEPVQSLGFEIHNHTIYSLIYNSLGISFDIDHYDMENIFWDAASIGDTMPGIVSVLDYLKAHSIPMGVCSNICFSQKALEKRIHRLLPGCGFEFIISSAEIGIRKPGRLIFDEVIKKAGVPPEKIWFCGDNVAADIIGAEKAGMFPVWYDDSSRENQWRDTSGAMPGGEHLHITHWQELIDILETL